MITGANGFLGQALCAQAVVRGMGVRGATRLPHVQLAGVEPCAVGDIDGLTPWQAALTGCEVVVHLAARVHVMQEVAAHPLAEFRKVNVEGTLNLARQAAAAGVRRFVFLSSIKVNGDATQPGVPYRADDTPAPQDPYGLSKFEAEQGLHQIALQTGMELVVIRPPLVYGPGVKANFASMMRLLQRGIPLPLGAIHNRRSLVALDNLVDLIVTCITHPAAINQTFLVSDGEDVSTPELLRRTGQAMGHPARLLPVPTPCLRLAAAVVGRQDMAERLCGSLQLDIEKTQRLLGWRPPLTLDQGLKQAVKGYGREAGR
jgi:nucleoside-diphosphate-sugar epimerase